VGVSALTASAAPACKEATVENRVAQDVVVVPDETWSAVLTPGQVLFLCDNADDPAD